MSNEAPSNGARKTLPLVPLICRLRGIKRAATIPDAELSDLAGHCGAWSHRWGVVVIVGVFLDVWLAWIDAPDTTFIGRWVPVIASGCVAIGVWLEIVFSKFESTHQGELVRRSNARLAVAQKEATVARIEAREAADEAELARTETILLTVRAAELEVKAAEANERAAATELELAKFRSPRTFTPEQSDALIEALGRYEGTKVDILACGEGELIQFAGVLMPIFHAARWFPAAFQNVGGGLSVVGVRIRVMADADSTIRDAARVIAGGLCNAGIDAFEMADFQSYETPMGQVVGRLLPWVPAERAHIRIMIGPKT